MRPLTVGGLLHQATVPPSSRNAAVRRWSVRRPHVHSLFMLNVGLVGFGFAGKVFHAPVIRAVAGLRLDAIVQRHGTPDPGYAGVDFVTSVDELLTRPVDLVVIATPNTSHHPIAQQCLLAGRHVVIDKPFAPTLAEAQGLVELAEAQRRGPSGRMRSWSRCTTQPCGRSGAGPCCRPRRARALPCTVRQVPSLSTESMHRKPH